MIYSELPASAYSSGSPSWNIDLNACISHHNFEQIQTILMKKPSVLSDDIFKTIHVIQVSSIKLNYKHYQVNDGNHRG